jgi:HK97 family phage prohead protease
MPYSITDKNADCNGWAVVDPANKVFGCHTTKQAAIQQAVAISLATDEPFVGERKADGNPIVIVDIDGTLINGGRLNQKVYDYAHSLDGAIYIVTGRPTSDRANTEKQLADLGVSYSRLIMNPGSTSDSVDYKKATAEKLLETFNVIAALENNPDAVRAYRSLGIDAMTPSDIPDTRDAVMDAQEWAGLSERQQEQAKDTAELALNFGQFNQGSDANGAHYFADNPFAAEGIKCGNCIFFNEERNQCVVVEGNIDSEAVCKLWVIPESEIMANRNAPVEGRALPNEVAVGDFVAWLVQTEAFAGQIVAIDGDMAKVMLWDDEEDVWASMGVEANVAISELKVIDPLVVEEVPTLTESNIVPTRSKWLNAAYAIKARIEDGTPEARSLGKHEVRTKQMELRAIGDGMTFEGYAAVFNSPSEPLPFTEIVAPGAFARSLKSRNRMMLLWNHDTSEPLASTRNGSLRMVEDATGLKVTATLPDTTRGRDVAELVRTGVIDSMSFGFSVKKDSWSTDGQTRTLQDVTLYEVSLVSQPAYEGTAGKTSVREAGLDADALADALQRLETGEELTTSQATIINQVVDKLKTPEDVDALETDLLALKKKKIEILEMSA